MSLGVGSDKGEAVSSRRVLRVTGEDAVGSSDAERFRDDADVEDSIEGDLKRLRPSAVDKRVGEELDEFCIASQAGNCLALSPETLPPSFSRPNPILSPVIVLLPTLIFRCISYYQPSTS